MSWLFLLKRYSCTTVIDFADGLVERVVLLGAPVAIQGENWGAARKVSIKLLDETKI